MLLFATFIQVKGGPAWKMTPPPLPFTIFLIIHIAQFYVTELAFWN